MISWLVSQIIPTSIAVCALLLAHKHLLNRLGAINIYYLWAMIPLTLMLSFVRIPSISALPNGDIYHFVVSSQESVQIMADSQWMIGIWGGGVACLLISVFLFDYKPYKDKSLAIHPKNHLQNKLPISVVLFQSDSVDSPMICGLFRPKLVVPSNFSQRYSPAEQTLIIEHELCHFARKDLFCNVIALTILSLFWFNPLLWVAYIRFRKDQELACDTQVLANKDKTAKVTYSRALLKCAAHSRQFSFAQLPYGDKRTMTERILQIKTMRPVSKLISACTLTLAVFASMSLSYAGNEQGVKKELQKVVAPVYRIEPKYPAQAVKENISGYVVLQFDIAPNGEVNDINVIKSRPVGMFDKNSITALAQWKYQESTHGENNVLVQLDYALDEPLPGIERVKVSQ